MALKARYTLASNLAQKLLSDSKVIYPPIPVESILKHLKIEFLPYNFPENVSAVLMKLDGITVVGVNKTHPSNRKNFSVAHEIGHFMLGHHVDFIVDIEGVSDGRFDTEHANELQEREANHFAGELLMPTNLLKEDFMKNRDVKKLAEKYQVSEQALWIRLMILKMV